MLTPWGHFGSQGRFEGQKGQKSRLSDFHKNFTKKVVWCGKFKKDKIYGKCYPLGVHFGGQR